MTLCIAALADDRKTLIMAADRMVSVPFIESEPEISKIFPLSQNWWVMLAAESLAGAFPIIDSVKARWNSMTNNHVESVSELVASCYQEERLRRAEAEFLLPRGLTVARFLSDGKNWLPEITFRELDSALSLYNLGSEFLVCGFDDNGVGQILSVRNPGVGERHDIPGFHAMGSGVYGALYMMYYRELSFITPIHDWLYYIYEAKAFGEYAGAVGQETELLIARPNEEVQEDVDGFHTSLDRMWDHYRPGELNGRDRNVLKRLSAPKPVPPSESTGGSQ